MSSLDVGLLIGIPLGVTLACYGLARTNGWTLSDFKMWQLILASLHLTFAITMFILTTMNEAWIVNVNLQYNVWDVNDIGACTEDSPCSIDLAVKNLGDFHTTYIVPFFSIVSGLHHAYAAYSYRKDENGGSYGNAVKSGVNYYRWFDYAISSSLMIVVLDILFVAPPDLRSLAFAATIQALVILSGYSSDVARSAQNFSSAFVILMASSLLYFFFFFLQGWVFGEGVQESEAPAVVYIFVVFIAITFSSFAVVQFVYTFKEQNAKNEGIEQLRFNQEVWFSVLSFWAKIPLLSTFYFGLTTRSSNSIQVRNPITTTTTTTSTTTTTIDETEFEQYLPFMVTAIVCGSLGLIMLLKLISRQASQTSSSALYARVENKQIRY